MFSLDGYRALRTSAARVRRTDRGVIVLAGRDRAAWLQGLVTQDVAAMAPGERRYAAYLTPQGRMITDLWVAARPDHLLLDVPAPLAASLRDRLDGLIFAEDVQVTDESARIAVWEVYGPLARATVGGLYIDAGEALPAEAAALPEVNLETLDVVRVEDGTPKFLVDMDEDTIPLEAGIEDRAISFTKGCYVGQEVIVRVTTRGGGRVAKRLVRLKFAPGLQAFKPSGLLFSGDREIGRITSVAYSPGQDAIVALGYVHRDFVEPGTEVTAVWDNARAKAVVH
jgi:tRNA-modifying protein YgfZ